MGIHIWRLGSREPTVFLLLLSDPSVAGSLRGYVDKAYVSPDAAHPTHPPPPPLHSHRCLASARCPALPPLPLPPPPPPPTLVPVYHSVRKIVERLSLHVYIYVCATTMVLIVSGQTGSYIYTQKCMFVVAADQAFFSTAAKLPATMMLSCYDKYNYCYTIPRAQKHNTLHLAQIHARTRTHARIHALQTKPSLQQLLPYNAYVQL